MKEPYKTYRCGCVSPVRGRIIPCKKHQTCGARLQNQRLYRQSLEPREPVSK